MNKFVKILMVLVSLVLLAGLVLTLSLLVPIPGLTTFTDNLVRNNEWLLTALAVVVLFFIVLTVVSILTDFFIPSTKDKYVVGRDMGQIEIADKSIESVASLAMSEVPGVRRYSAKVKGRPHPGKVKLDLFAETDNTVGLTTTGADIQDHVTRRLAESLDLKPSHLHVDMQPYEEARAAKNVRAPRVI